MSLLTLLIILLVVAVLFGGYGTTRNWGYYGWTPLGIIVVILLILLLTGNLAL
jgi:Sec-independent protein translocase protein TatA